MSRPISRKELLRGLLSYLREGQDGGDAPDRATVLLRPPGACSPDAAYLARCTGCERCLPACPPGALFMADEGGHRIAVLDPVRRPCLLCDGLPCIAACPDGALLPLSGPAGVRVGVAQVDPRRCRTFSGTECDLCVRTCPLSGTAIVAINGKPLVKPDACTGCGVCAAACPERPRAITVYAERELMPGIRLPRITGQRNR